MMHLISNFLRRLTGRQRVCPVMPPPMIHGVCRGGRQVRTDHVNFTQEPQDG